MTTVTDLRITLQGAGRTRTLTLAELERGLHFRPLGMGLVRLLFAAPSDHEPKPIVDWDSQADIHGEDGGKGVDGASPQDSTLTQMNQSALASGDTERGPGETQGGADNASLGTSPGALAQYLADRLDDAKSLRFYRLVARTVPNEVVRDALVRTLDTLPRDIRNSRAALFTSIVRPHLPHRAV